MFKNPGGKLKVIALVVFIFICTASTIGAIITWAAGDMVYTFVPGFLCFAIGPGVAWLSSISLYAFGQLVASAEEHTRQNDQIIRELKKLNAGEADEMKQLEAQAAVTALQAVSAPRPVQTPAPVPARVSAATPVVPQKTPAASEKKWRCTKCG